jgi:EmrB/QacA subfamily drug resistance transporter
LAVAIGPITGGLLIEHFWWGSVFLVNLPIVLISMVLISLIVPESRDPKPSKLDPVGVIMSIIGLVAITYGVIRGGELATIASAQVLVPTILGVAVLAAFVWYERRIDHPAFDVTYFRDPRFATAVGMIGIMFFAMMGSLFFLVFYLQIVLGFSPLQAGALMIPFAAAQLIFAPLSQQVSRRFGGKLAGTVSMVIVAGALASYALMDANTSILLIEIVFFVQGAAMANIMPPATTAIMESLPREKAGVGSAMSNTVRQVSGALGVALLGSMLSTVYRDEIAPALAGLPESARHTAGESLTDTLKVAQGLGARGAELIEPAKLAFVDGMHITALVSAGIALVGALVVFKWLPGKNAETLAPENRDRDKEPAVV